MSYTLRTGARIGGTVIGASRTPGDDGLTAPGDKSMTCEMDG